MPFRTVLRPIILVGVLLTACTSAVGQPETPDPLPSPSGAWTMKLTQTGGFAGVQLTVEITSDGRLTAENPRAGLSVKRSLPAEKLAQLQGLYASASMATPAGARTSCADCFLYRLELTSGGRATQVQFDDTTLDASGMAELIHFLQKLRDEALRGAP